MKVKTKSGTFYLHSNGRLYWFAKKKTGRALGQVPKGYAVKINERTGLPYLKKRALGGIC